MLKICSSSLSTLVVALSASAALAQSGTQSGTPEPTYDGRNASYELSAGSTLRVGDRLTDRLLVTVWQRTTVKGSGTCSANACPIMYNGEEMFARRSRLTLVSASSDGNRGNRTTGDDRNRDRSTSDNRYPSGWVRLQRGDRGDKVKQLQELLVRDGARLKPDGTFGRTTEAAIRDVQRRRRLTVDGVAGYETLRALGV
jgi:Putative peptidoglycan binding domain